MKTSHDEAAQRRLIEAAQKDPRHFAELYEENFERVYAFVARRVHDREQAQDITADVFHQALKSIARFEWRGVPFSAWLVKIAANAITDHSRRSTREREIPDPNELREPSPDQTEPRARLFKLVDRLPLAQRRVIMLRFAEQKTIREIARELGRTEGAIKQLQLRGLQNLKARLGDKSG